MKTPFLSILIIPLLVAIAANSLPPPNDIVDMNSKAAFISIGEISNIKETDETPYFELSVLHIIKGTEFVKQGKKIKVLLPTKAKKSDKIDKMVQGVVPVKVTQGTLVIVYLNPSTLHSGYFEPLLKGLSVVTIGKPLSL